MYLVFFLVSRTVCCLDTRKIGWTEGYSATLRYDYLQDQDHPWKVRVHSTAHWGPLAQEEADRVSSGPGSASSWWGEVQLHQSCRRWSALYVGTERRLVPLHNVIAVIVSCLTVWWFDSPNQHDFLGHSTDKDVIFQSTGESVRVYGHVLLIPHVLGHKHQRIDNSSFLLALHLAKETANPFFRVRVQVSGCKPHVDHHDIFKNSIWPFVTDLWSKKLILAPNILMGKISIKSYCNRLYVKNHSAWSWILLWIDVIWVETQLSLIRHVPPN